MLQQIVDIAREHQLIIFSDEIYDRLVMDGLQHISIASMAPDLFCVTFSGLSKSHMIAGYRIGWMILSGNKRIAKDYIEGLNMLANMRCVRTCPPSPWCRPRSAATRAFNDYIVPGGRVHDQRDLVYDMLNQIPGITAVKPKAAFYIFPKIDVKRFNIHSDEQFALDLLHDKHILISHGGAFNWHRPDHFPRGVTCRAWACCAKPWGRSPTSSATTGRADPWYRRTRSMPGWAPNRCPVWP